MDWKALLAYITGAVDQALLLRNEYLVMENRILRNQINWSPSAPCALRALSPPPSPSPIKGEGIEEGESLPEIALASCEGSTISPRHPVKCVLATYPAAVLISFAWLRKVPHCVGAVAVQ